MPAKPRVPGLSRYPKNERVVVPGWEDAAYGKSRLDRFWSKVILGGKNKCWLWIGGIGSDGYGYFTVSRKRRVLGSHVVSFFLSGRTLDKGQWVLHRCHNPLCVNPHHLYAGTPTQNVSDRRRSGRSAWGERNGYFSLSTKDVKEAVQLYFEDNLTPKEIADCLGVSQSLIYKIVAGEARLGENT